ncbi:MAG TPA: tetratricopeptide repeat protein, partial [Phormidium sp.]
MIHRFYQLSLITATLFLSFSPCSLGETTPKIANTLAQTATIDRKVEAETLIKTGLQQLENNQAEAAIKSFQQALTIYQEIKDHQGEGETLKNLGNAYFAAKNNTKALEFYQQSLTIAREIKSRDLEGKALQNIGTIYRLQENYTKAVEYLEPALLI